MSTYTLKWGILSTGQISSVFAKDVRVPPATRGVSDIEHKIVAVASRNKEKAESFADEFCGGKEGIECYGSYEEFYQDPDVNCIYIGTPHSHHYRNTLACLKAGKSVLLEKPATVTAEQAMELLKVAKEKNVFFMEACWTRFFPMTYEIQEIIKSGKLGKINHVHAEFNMTPPIRTTMDASHRLIDPNLAGGSILDQGPYPFIWLSLVLMHPLMWANPTSISTPLPLPHITSSMVFSEPSLTQKLGGQIDLHTFAVMKFPRCWPKTEGEEGEISAVLETSLISKSMSDRCVFLSCENGYLTVHFPPFRAQEYAVKFFATEPGKEDKVINKKFEFPGGAHGFIWEADECARCIRDGKVQSDRMPWRETTLMMQIFDEIRR